MHSEKIHGLYSSLNIIRLRWAERVARMEEKRNAYRDFVAKS
jgi:hypothetical protein